MKVKKFELINKWLYLQNKDISIFKSLEEQGIDKIILYGASEFALRLLEQCDKNGMNVVAITDKKISSRSGYYRNIPLITMSDLLEWDMENTCIVITAMGFYDEIADELIKKGITKFISLQKLIYDVL